MFTIKETERALIRIFMDEDIRPEAIIILRVDDPDNVNTQVTLDIPFIYSIMRYANGKYKEVGYAGFSTENIIDAKPKKRAKICAKEFKDALKQVNIDYDTTHYMTASFSVQPYSTVFMNEHCDDIDEYHQTGNVLVITMYRMNSKKFFRLRAIE